VIVLDTNVVSEPFRTQPDDRLRRWLDDQRRHDLFICTPVLAELRYGIELLPSGRKRDRLERWVHELEEVSFANRILPLDRGAAHEFGRIVARRTKAGGPIAPMDALIASIALSNEATLATRDIGDFAELGLRLVNPFGAAPGL
jgi:toxin FitB